jgi:hypothetical protein
MKKSEFWIIVVLIILAIVISIASIVIANNKTSSSKGITGQVTGNVTAFMDSMTSFVLDPAIVNFGNISLGQNNDTDTGPAPFGTENTGTVNINMTIESNNPLFTGTSPTYQFKSVCSEESCAADVYGWTTFNQDAQNLVQILEFNNSKDLLNVGIKIYVPLDEPSGSKSDVLIFTATEAA